MSFTVAIIGRPNVGKSTLFNRLVGKRLALVHDEPGVTRDLREADANIGPLEFRVIDTAGLEDATGDKLEARMRGLTERAIEQADVCLFLIDARAGVTPLDSYFADLLRRAETPVTLIANKCEGKAGSAGFYESYSLGLGDPIAVSAEHGEGISDLYDALLPYELLADVNEGAEIDHKDRPLKIAIVGRPNAGKSTLINYLIGQERLLTGPEAGITRDSIAVDYVWRNDNGEERALQFHDTAGMRKRARVQDKLEKLSVSDGIRAVKFAEIVVLLLDAQQPFEKQDLVIADLVEREGRGLVIGINKWDLIDDKPAALKELRLLLGELLPQVRGIPLVPFSALTGRGVDKLLPAILKVEDQWNTRVGTGQLNRWLAEAVAKHPPPAAKGRHIRIRYMTQPTSRPPTFAAFSSRADDLPESYRRYLVNNLRTAFELEATPIRFAFRAGKNPYADKDK